MTKRPKVSVIVPNFNHAPYLGERLESIYNQSFQDFEVVLLDDASTDDSLAILQEYSGRPNTRLIVNPVNSGSTFAQWNKGVAEARGEYCWIAESDDVADPEMLERLVPILDSNPEVVIAHCDSRILSETGEILKDTLSHRLQSAYNLKGYDMDHILSGLEQIRTRMVECSAISNASAVLFRRDLYQKVGGADPGMRLAGDKLLWVKLLELGKYAFVAAPLNFWRIHENTVRFKVNSASGATEELMSVLQYMEDRGLIGADELFQVLEHVWSDEYRNQLKRHWLRELTIADTIKHIRPEAYLDCLSLTEIALHCGRRVKRGMRRRLKGNPDVR